MNPHHLDYHISRLRDANDTGSDAVAKAIDDLEANIKRDKEEWDRDSRQEYFGSVENIAQEILDYAIEADTPATPESVERYLDVGGYDDIHDQVDGSHWIIYTYASKKVLEYSDNDSRLFDDFGSDAIQKDDDLDKIICRAAFCAMEADVREKLDELKDAWVEAYEEPEDEDEEEDEDEQPTP